jgi:hypothetical protein
MKINFSAILGVILGCSVLGCKSDDKGGEPVDRSCRDEACPTQCAAKNAPDYPESYWTFDGWCDDEEMCRCWPRCDEELCNVDYCQKERGAEGGTCFLACECFYGGEDPDGGETDSDSS